MYQVDPIDFIRSIRESFTGSVTVYTSGSCFQLYRMLKTIYPDAVAMQDRGGHIVTNIDGKVYDITGELSGAFLPVDPAEYKRLEQHKYEIHIPDMLQVKDIF